MTAPAPPAAPANRDFDFLVGAWRTRQRRLQRRLQGDDEWETFEATCDNTRLPGGVGNVDTLVAESWRPGWVGMALRLYNPATNLWSIYWLTNDGGGLDAGSGRLEPPVVGRFDGDVGLFEGDDQFEGRPIRVRFRWTRCGADTARWEQAFSTDAGRSWEVNWVMEFERAQPAPATADASWPAVDFDSQVIELRQYTLHPGQRDLLIDLFDREFVETQEAQGMAVMGQFRDLDAANRFVWLRGFADMDSRTRGLAAFYGGPVWQQHCNEANATMVDFDDVWLLRPAWPGAGISMRGRRRAAGAVRMSLPGLLDARIFYLREPAAPALLAFCRQTMAPTLVRGGAEVLGWYVAETAPNGFPGLPVHEGQQVLVGFAMFANLAACQSFASSGLWQREVQPVLEQWLAGAPKGLRLVATARSAIHA